MLPPDPSHDDAGPAGPEASDASLRAALVNERLNAEQLRLLADQQGALLRRRSVRFVLSVDRRTRHGRERARRTVRRGRRRAARARLAASALPTRRAADARREEIAEARRSVPSPPPPRMSVSLVVVADAAPAVPAAIPGPSETLLVLTQPVDQLPDDLDATVVRAHHKTETAAVRDAVRRATGDVLVVVRSTTVGIEPGWLAHLAGAVEGHVVAATPQVLHPAREPTRATPHDLRVRHLGLEVVTGRDGAPVVRARRAGAQPDPDGPDVPVAAGTSAALAVRRDRWVDAGDLPAVGDLDAALFDLCARVRAGGGEVVAVPAALVTDTRPVPALAALTHPIAEHGLAWERVADRQRTTMARMAARRPGTDHLRIVLTIAAPSARVAPRWGDWHLAEGLARALRRKGHVVHVQALDEVDASDDLSDVHVVLRGAAPVARRGASRRVLWVISHPEAVASEECDEADLVLVASEVFARDLRTRTSTPVEVLLQATDATRFAPQQPDPRHAHAVAAVAMTRHVFRPSVRLALEAGLRPAIYGGGWEEFVDRQLVVARFVPNHRLPTVYSSIGVLLNDHWDSMRGWGFVSNRLFDGLACGTPIVSDRLPELERLFGDAVATYDSADDLRTAVDAALDDPVAARRRAEAGRAEVVAHHTFSQRADELVEALVRHDLVGGP